MSFLSSYLKKNYEADNRKLPLDFYLHWPLSKTKAAYVQLEFNKTLLPQQEQIQLRLNKYSVALLSNVKPSLYNAAYH